MVLRALYIHLVVGFWPKASEENRKTSVLDKNKVREGETPENDLNLYWIGFLDEINTDLSQPQHQRMASAKTSLDRSAAG